MKNFSSRWCAWLPLALAACAHAPAAPPAKAQVHWSYDGDDGPEHWAGLDPKFTACRDGKRQSPVDLTGAAPAPELVPFGISYAPLSGSILDNGHTIQIDLERGGTLEFGGRKFALKQFHFHTPAEHLRDGKRAALEIHLVHAADDGSLAVLAVQLELGAAHAGLAPLWGQLPGARETRKLKWLIDPTTLLPDARGYFTYEGSLTAPPCSENVTWLVLREAGTISAEQLALFHNHYTMNARASQLAAGRVVRSSP